MTDSDFRSVEKYLKSRGRRKPWYRVVTCLVCVVVFCTAYALILPGVTLEGTGCGIPEHNHSEDCYTQVTSLVQTVPVCNGETWHLHCHMPACYAEDGGLICGYGDFVVHSHDSACYDEEGTLWCTLPEIAAHTHGEGCYALPEEPHSHGADCYTRERGELICTEHAHEATCFAETEALICALEEQEGHQHGDACLDAAGELVCQREVSEGHHHGDGCYAVQRELTCGLVSDHQHGDECYSWNETLTCERSTEPTETAGEPVRICGKTEVLLHTHTPDCLDEAGNLICGKIQVLSHQHTELCFGTVAEPVDTQTLTCTQPQEGHTHTALCYGTWELTCDMQAHTHTEACVPAEATEATQPATEPAETSGEETDSGLPVMGTAYASGARDRTLSLFALDEEAANGPLTVDAYIKDATLCYRTEGQDWAVVSESVTVPGNAELKLEINYDKVPIADLLAADGKMTYQLPALLRNAKTNGNITSGGKKVGTLTVNGGVATLAFETKWLEDQRNSNNTYIDGDFYVEAEADLSMIDRENPGKILVGNREIIIKFEENVVAQYGNVELAKAVVALSEGEDGDYLTYTLTVTAGQDGCPEVKVVDAFADAAYVAEYVGVTKTPTATNVAGGPTETGGTGTVCITQNSEGETPGTLVWEVGDMAPNETRTLTYRVRLKEGLIGGKPKDLQNTAHVFSKDYPRDSKTATFAPQATGTMSKTHATFVPDEKGGGTLTYTIWIHADEKNTYTLDNVKIVDALDGSVENKNSTPKNILPHLSYEEDSFHLYAGGEKNQNGSTDLTPSSDGTGPVFPETDPEDRHNTGFAYNVGSLKPGESKTLVYSVKVDPGAFIAAGNGDVKINNRAAISVDGSAGNEAWQLNAYNDYATLDRKAWSRKLAGQKLETADTVSMTGEVYDLAGAFVSKIENPPASFTVPAGSYQYQVAANEAGDWDLSSVSMKDTMADANMVFVGYVRVDAYDIDGGGPASSLADGDAIANLRGHTPSETVWVKIDGQSTFTFKPTDIGLTEQNRAYLLTYYARPKTLEGFTQVLVTNQFRLDGTVGIGGEQYTIGGISAKADVLVEGSNSFTAVKQSWYYEAPQEGSGDFAMGALYWAIQVDGTVLPKGTVIRDGTASAGGETHHIRSDSLVGVYTGNLGDKPLTDYENLVKLLESGKLTSLSDGSYTADTSSEKVLQVTLDQDISLEGNSLYLVVKTAPTKLPEDKRDTVTYNNKLDSQYNSSTWLEHNVATKTLYGSENIFKELGQVGTYVDGVWKMEVEGKKQAVDRDHLIGNGTYVAWQIHLNYEGNLYGRYRVEEQIPEGMELAYVRLWWLGNEAKNQSPRPCFVPIADSELSTLGGSWTAHTNTMNLNLQQGESTNYYYTNGQRVIWDIANLVAGVGKRDNYAVAIQVVCRVTDPKVLLGGETKDFNNQVTLYNSEGKPIGSDSDSVSIQKQTLSKTGTYEKANGGRYPFKITLNELGEDLVKGSDTITLVDELSDTLTLDATTIKVFTQKKKGEQIAVDFTASVEGQTLKITLPDDKPLTITYEATVNAAPGVPVDLSNEAHWLGYATSDGGKVEVKNFEYAAGGTVGASGTPTVTVKKLDKYNIQLPLSGAVFQLVEGTYTENGFAETAGGLTLTATTGEDGTLTFGKDLDKPMKYNTVYRLTEIAAPAGYVLDKTPHYFAVVEQGTTPTFPGDVTTWHQGADYTYLAYNHKGEATVTKKFLGQNGDAVEKIDGTYRFGLYDTEEPTGDPLQTVSITYDKNTVTSAKFTNLELGRTYYVYELDDSGRPITSGSGTVSGKPFLVTYTDNTVEVTADSPTANVTVTNQVNYPELPLTGGRGTTHIYLLGSLLALAAGMLLATRKRMGRSQ